MRQGAGNDSIGGQSPRETYQNSAPRCAHCLDRGAGFDALTIGEFSMRAMVSRAAFYRNYQDKYDLVEQVFEEAMRALLGAIGDLGREHPADIWVKFFEHIAQYDRLYRAM